MNAAGLLAGRVTAALSVVPLIVTVTVASILVPAPKSTFSLHWTRVLT